MQARHYIVAATDEDSLQACIALKLPCLNASFVLGDAGDKISEKLLAMNSKDCESNALQGWERACMHGTACSVACRHRYADIWCHAQPHLR